MLDINLGVMLLIAAIFLVTAYFLKVWLFDPLVQFMDEREEKLKRELEMINQNAEETKEIEEEIKTILQLAREDEKRILEEARMKALEEAERIKAIKQKEIEEAKESLRLMLEKEKEKILSDLSKEKDEIKALVENKLRNAA